MRKVVLTEHERAEFDKVIEEYIDDNSYTDYWGEEVLTQGGSLGLVQKKRQVASSVYAYLNSEVSLDNGIDEYAEYPDAKFEELLKIIDEVFSHGNKKIVIFALFRKTLKYLQIRFKQRGFGTLMIHGMVDNLSMCWMSSKIIKTPTFSCLPKWEVKVWTCSSAIRWSTMTYPGTRW